MIDYDKIINELTQEAEDCCHRYNGMVPSYYQTRIAAAVAILIECRDNLKFLNDPPKGETGHDTYKVIQLMKMLKRETVTEETHYGARLHHPAKDTNVLTIDAGGLRALIRHYAMHGTDLENGEENDG